MVEPPRARAARCPRAPRPACRPSCRPATRGPSPSTQTAPPDGDAVSARRVTGADAGPRRQDHRGEGVGPSALPQLDLPAVGPEQRPTAGPAGCGAGSRGVGARQCGTTLAGGHARGRDPSSAARSRSGARTDPGGRGREPGAALARQPVDAGAEQVRRLRREDRIRLGLVDGPTAGARRRRGGRRRGALEQQRALTGADPDLRRPWGRRGTDQQAAGGEGGTPNSEAPAAARRRNRSHRRSSPAGPSNAPSRGA